MILKEKPRSGLRRAAAVLFLLGIAAMLTILSSDSIHGRWAHPKTILVSGSYVAVNDALRLNRFTAEDFAQDENGRMRYLSGRFRTGVDVSVFQGDIDWAKVAADGVDFAFLRVGSRSFSSGEMKLDAHFIKNAEGAAEHGLDVGVYFFSQAVTPEEAVEEARFVLELLKGQNVTLPVVFDWESVDEELDPEGIARTRDADSETVTACALAFLQTVEEAGRTGMLYCNNQSGYFLYDLAQLQDYPIWYANYSAGWPSFYYGVDLWQYSQSGTVAGIEGNVDLNLLPVDTDPADASLLRPGSSESGNAGMVSDGSVSADSGVTKASGADSGVSVSSGADKRATIASGADSSVTKASGADSSVTKASGQG